MRDFRRYSILGFLLFSILVAPVKAQSIKSADDLYYQFFALKQNGGDKVQMYDTLYESYKIYYEQSNRDDIDAYMKAKNMLREMQVDLMNGAIYYSQTQDAQKALKLAQAYIDLHLSKMFQGETLPKNNYYSTMVYFAASGTYNDGDYSRAINYFKEYLRMGEQKNRRSIYLFMAKSCLNSGNRDLAKIVLEEGVANYPTDFDLLSMAINYCIDYKDYGNLSQYVSRALTIKPGDLTLLNIQGKIYEDALDYTSALRIYTTMRNASPNNLEIVKHLALNYYNIAVDKYNQGMNAEKSKIAKQYFASAEDYFIAAEQSLTEVLKSDPSSLKYLTALAVTYNCLERTTELRKINEKLLSVGGSPVLKTSIPALVAYSDSNAKFMNNESAANSGNSVFESDNFASNSGEVPLFSVYAKNTIEKKLELWQQKDPYETAEEYRLRVSGDNRKAKVDELMKIAEDEYLLYYANNLKIDNLSLEPYDAENRSFLAVSLQYGQVIIPVPRENKEAELFEKSWGAVKFQDPEFYILNDKLTLSALTVVTPAGKSYRYDDSAALKYTKTEVDINFGDVGAEIYASTEGKQAASQVSEKTISIGTSDIDINIPVAKDVNPNTFVVIIANENYQLVSKVPMAINDGQIFNHYCEKTLGIPKENIRLYNDATSGTFISAIRDIKNISKAKNGNIRVLFYYAGHGIPDESTKDAFLLPVDIDGQHTDGCYSLKKLYSDLGEMNANEVVVFLDACFSGAKRDGGTIASTSRGVAIKTKPADPLGNMVVFSAASDDETALPYVEKGHGLFTYYLVKKLQETKGNVTLAALGEYVTQKVMEQSIIVNRKMQTPSVIPSQSFSKSWRKIKLNE